MWKHPPPRRPALPILATAALLLGGCLNSLEASLRRGDREIWSASYDDYAHRWVGWIFFFSTTELEPADHLAAGSREVLDRAVSAAARELVAVVAAQCGVRS